MLCDFLLHYMLLGKIISFTQILGSCTFFSESSSVFLPLTLKRKTTKKRGRSLLRYQFFHSFIDQPDDFSIAFLLVHPHPQNLRKDLKLQQEERGWYQELTGRSLRWNGCEQLYSHNYHKRLLRYYLILGRLYIKSHRSPKKPFLIDS